MLKIRLELVAVFSLIALVFFGGFVTGRHYDDPVLVQQQAHAQQDLGDGNMLAANTGSGQPVIASTVVPPGTAAVATAHITMKPERPVYVAPPAASGVAAAPVTEPADCAGYVANLMCPAQVVDETLVKGKGGQLDLVVKDAGGAALDQVSFNPGSLLLAPPSHPWAAGVAFPLWLPGAKPGVVVERDISVFRVGADVIPVNGRAAALATFVYRW